MRWTPSCAPASRTSSSPCNKVHKTIVIVTHDLDEALRRRRPGRRAERGWDPRAIRCSRRSDASTGDAVRRGIRRRRPQRSPPRPVDGGGRRASPGPGRRHRRRAGAGIRAHGTRRGRVARRTRRRRVRRLDRRRRRTSSGRLGSEAVRPAPRRSNRPGDPDRLVALGDGHDHGLQHLGGGHQRRRSLRWCDHARGPPTHPGCPR